VGHRVHFAVSLLLNLSWLFGILLLPGGMAAAVLLKPSLDDENALVFAANVIVYTLVGFGVILRFFRNAQSKRLGQMAAWLIVPVTTLGVLACLPSMVLSGHTVWRNWRGRSQTFTK
jgi:hypothetical protein